METSFNRRLELEFEERRRKNSRYSMRAFALLLGVDHSTLSQILRGTRRMPAGRIRAWAKRLGIRNDEAAIYIAAEYLMDSPTAARQEQLRHWVAEAASIMTEKVHREILRLSRSPGFRADSRWIAEQIGVSVDTVNVALSRLLRLRLIEVSPTGQWKDLTGLPNLIAREFQSLALKRVREMAAER
jgi:transcriptional regulator with XRE-family HTH domain